MKQALPKSQVDKAVRLLMAGQNIVIYTDPSLPPRVLTEQEAQKIRDEPNHG